MKSINFSLVVAAGLCTGLLLTQASSCSADSTAPAAYQTPSDAQLAEAEQLFSWLFSGQSLERARSSATALGFSWQETETQMTLLDEKKQGWGDYHFSKLPGDGVALQAPHRYHDIHTGTIARKLFALQGFSSIALNSVSRRTPLDQESPRTADMAHLTESFHTAYSRAFVARYPQGKLIQLHGFSSTKRNSPAARETSMILSTGSSWSSAYLLDIQHCLTGQGWHSLRYPQQVRELGATRNTIGSLLRKLGHGGFTHIEMNLETRKQLISDEARLKSFADCLLESAP